MTVAWHRPEYDIMHILKPLSSRSRLYFALSWILELTVRMIFLKELRSLTLLNVDTCHILFSPPDPTAASYPASRLQFSPTPPFTFYDASQSAGYSCPSDDS